ncbi:MAG: hypothetical protein HY672_03835 [Chloroflexi bacterium]|nr:hypothetical protein [Chloroflexota bacterium]
MEQSAPSENVSIPPEILEKLPPPERRRIEQFFAAGMSFGNPVLQRLTPQHISDLISLSSKEADLEFKDRHRSRLTLSLMVGFLVVVFVAFAIVLAYRNLSDLLQELLKDAALIIGGAGTGFGYGSWRRRRD